MPMDLPTQRYIDRRQGYAQFLGKRREIVQHGEVVEVLLLEDDTSTNEHYPSDPSPFLRPDTHSWNCPGPSGPCAWLGVL